MHGYGHGYTGTGTGTGTNTGPQEEKNMLEQVLTDEEKNIVGQL